MNQLLLHSQNFVQSLSDYFFDIENEQNSNKFQEIHLFSLLFRKISSKNIKISPEKIKEKIFQCFKTFFELNFESIKEKKLTENIIRYNEQIFIDFEKIFSNIEQENQEIIWQHILVLDSFFNQRKIENLKIEKEDMYNDILPIMKSVIPTASNDFISNIVSKIDNFIPKELKENKDNLQPMDLLTKILSSSNIESLAKDLEKDFSTIDEKSININSLQSLLLPMMSALQQNQ